MAKQTYISYLKDKAGNMVDFERWGYKSVKIVKRDLKKLYNGTFSCAFYKDAMQTGCIEIYSTPDGYNTKELVFKEEIKKFLEEDKKNVRC